MANATVGGQPAITKAGAFDASSAKDIQNVLTQGDAVVLMGTTDAIPFPGLVILNSSGADACTLATAVAGPQPQGDDGKTITLLNASAQAHTVTTAANKIANNKHVLTFAATAGSNIELQAWNGLWFPLGPTGAQNGVTIS